MGLLSFSLADMRIRFVAAFAAIATALALMVVMAPPARAGMADPTIASDLADYPPGGLVTLTGQNWTPGLGVNIRVDDSVGAGWFLDS